MYLPHRLPAQRAIGAVITEVVGILNIWSQLEAAYRRLEPEDRERVQQEGPSDDAVQLQGFGGNDETDHLGVVETLIWDLDRFHEFRGRNLNASMPTLEKHRRIPTKFDPIFKGRMFGQLAASEIIEILAEQLHVSPAREP